VNVEQLVRVLEVMENFGAQAVGFDARTSYKAQSDKVGIVAVLKEEQSQRARPVARNRNLGLGHAFTIMLLNIAKFAPYKYAELIFDEDTNEIADYDRYKIELPNMTIERNDDGDITDVKETPGENDEYSLVDTSIYDDESEDDDAPVGGDIDKKKDRNKRFGNFFDLNDSLLYKGRGLKVEIDTPSSTSSMKSIDKIDLQETIAALTNQFQITQDPSILEKLKKLNDRLYSYYEVESEDLSIASKADERRKFIAESMNIVGNLDNDLSSPKQPNVEDLTASSPAPG
jgi:hypothetical protein